MHKIIPTNKDNGWAIRYIVMIASLWVTATASAETKQIAGTTFTMDRPAIEQFVKTADGESYTIGHYMTGEHSWGYFPQTYIYHDYSFRNPGQNAANRHLAYKYMSYAPIRIFRTDPSTNRQVTVGHLLIDSNGQVVTDRETLLVLYTAMHTFGLMTRGTIQNQIDFFSNERIAITDDLADYETQLSLGKDLKTWTTAGSVALSAIGGDPSGAALSLFSTALFFKELQQIDGQSADLAPRTITQQLGSVAELASLATAGKGTIDMIKKFDKLNKLRTAQKAKPLSFAQAFSRSINQDVVKQTLEKKKVKLDASAVGLALGAVEFLEDSDGFTKKSAEWRIKGEAALKLVDKIIMTLRGIDDGIRDRAEAEEIQNLKYTVASFAYLRGSLLKETLDNQEYREKHTPSGRIYGFGKWVGIVEEGPDEAGRALSRWYLGNSESDLPGLANTAIDGYNIDLALAAAQTALTLARVGGDFSPPKEPALGNHIRWAGDVSAENIVGSTAYLEGKPDGRTVGIKNKNSVAKVGEFGRDVSEFDAGDLAALLGIDQPTLKRGNFIVFEHNGSPNTQFESSRWHFRNFLTGKEIEVRHSFQQPAVSEHLVAYGSLKVADYKSFFSISKGWSTGAIPFLLFSVPEDVLSDSMQVDIYSDEPTAEGTPDPEALGILRHE